MAESVDALVSNTNVRKDVPVRPRLRVPRGWLLPSFFCTRSRGRTQFMPRGSAPIVPCGSAFRICLFHRQIHGSRRRARARIFLPQYCCPHKKVSFGWPFCVDEGTPGAQHHERRLALGTTALRSPPMHRRTALKASLLAFL